jgi:hypothetical protein
MYDLKGSLHTRYVGDEERFTGKVSVLKDLNFCNRHDGTDRWAERITVHRSGERIEVPNLSCPEKHGPASYEAHQRLSLTLLSVFVQPRA